MSEESPLEYYVRKATEFGINPKILFKECESHYPAIGIPIEAWKDLDLAKLKHNDQFLLDVTYVSERSPQNILLLAVQKLFLDVTPLVDAHTHPSIAEVTYDFSLIALRKDESKQNNDVVTILVKDGLINNDQFTPMISGFDSDNIPQQLFKVGNDYKPALDWMLQKYAAGFTKKV